MENRGSGVQRKLVVRNNTGSAPLLAIEIDLQHVVRHDLSEAKLLVGHLRLGILRTLNNNVGFLEGIRKANNYSSRKTTSKHNAL